MLDQIETTIKNLPSISFEEYYVHYIDEIENHIIETETSRMFALIHDRKSVAHIEKSIENLMKGVEDLV